jgi:dTDP-3-amino-3,4,6-trideoxy-alpha-D-glucose transaminase
VNAAGRVPFIDLRPGEDAAAVRAAIDRVVERGWFVLGPEGEAFEAEFAAASGARFAVGVANGTDALTLLLRAHGIGAGDEVLVPAMTAGYTALAVVAAGATPRFVDVDRDTLTLDPAACTSAVTARTRAMVPVHLYGQPANLDALGRVAQAHALLMVEDCCQGHLATARGTPVGTAHGGAFSFYPTKNLGAFGDGGAVTTSDPAIADRVRRLRNGGQADRYHHAEAGINSRLDEMQAAILRAKLPFLADWTARRRRLAAAYRQALPASVTPIPERDAGHVYHLFPVRSPERDQLQAHLAEAGIDTLIHYPVPLPAQPAFAAAVAAASGGEAPGEAAGAAWPEATRAAHELLSLPLHPRLSNADLTRVVDAVAAHQTHQKGRVLA